MCHRVISGEFCPRFSSENFQCDGLGLSVLKLGLVLLFFFKLLLFRSDNGVLHAATSRLLLGCIFLISENFVYELLRGRNDVKVEGIGNQLFLGKGGKSSENSLKIILLLLRRVY